MSNNLKHGWFANHSYGSEKEWGVHWIEYEVCGRMYKIKKSSCNKLKGTYQYCHVFSTLVGAVDFLMAKADKAVSEYIAELENINQALKNIETARSRILKEYGKLTQKHDVLSIGES
ncbi:MAG: hypothetical protein KDH96_08220 [Candidatus Riesia sp.]|nr:hypothetical protein [Candidatus Riesia sp.]